VVPAIAAGAAVAAFTATAPALGMVQGAERFQALGTLVAVQAALRVTGGLAGMAIQPTAAGALVGIAVGLVLAGVVAWVVARPPLGWSHDGATKGTMRATLASGGMLLGFVVLTNVDVVLARHVLSAGADATGVTAMAFMDSIIRGSIIRRCLIRSCSAGGMARGIGVPGSSRKAKPAAIARRGQGRVCHLHWPLEPCGVRQAMGTGRWARKLEIRPCASRLRGAPRSVRMRGGGNGAIVVCPSRSAGHDPCRKLPLRQDRVRTRW